MQFVDPVPNKYMGLKNPESLLYDGAKYHCSNTLDPDFKPVKFYDITEYEIVNDFYIPWHIQTINSTYISP